MSHLLFLTQMGQSLVLRLPFCAPVFDQKWNVKNEEDRECDGFRFDNIPRPGSEHIQQGREIGFVRHEKIITADGQVDEENDDHVYIRPDKDTFEGLQGGAESLHNGHVDGDVNQQPVRDESLHDAEVREVIRGGVGWGEYSLHGSAESHEICEFVNAIIFSHQHVGR